MSQVIYFESFFFSQSPHRQLEVEHGFKPLYFRRSLRNSASNPNGFDLPMWGSFEVHNSPKEAYASLAEEEVDEQRTRLVQIGNNSQLARLEKRVVSSQGRAVHAACAHVSFVLGDMGYKNR